MKNIKFGFTLGEVLCALGIIGICTALALTTMKPAEKKATKYLYMNAYNSLEKAYYNYVLIGKNPFREEPDETGNVLIHSDTEDTGTQLLCEGLTTYINTATNKKDADDDFSTTCSSTKLTSEMAEPEDFTDDNVQFIASNGMKFYISKLITKDDLKFYLVFVDINGSKKPNSIEYTYKFTHIESEKKAEKNRIEPDIYAFAILDTGRICPIGIPEYDSNVLTARFAYFTDSGDPLYTHKSMAYYQAKGAAWGYYSGTKPDPMEYNPDEPFTMNDAIRAAINSGSKIVSDFPDLKSLEPSSLSGSAPYHCSNEDLESCYIFLDEYRQ